jgi:hypothetical protein
MLVVGASGSTVLRSLSGLIDVGWHPSTMGVLTFRCPLCQHGRSVDVIVCRTRLYGMLCPFDER